MPMNRADYPANWDAFSSWVRFVRARGQCECQGECHLGVPWGHLQRCLEINHQPGRWQHGKVILTVAHTCACRPLCAIPDHVKAMCQSCHLRFDRYVHHQLRNGRKTLFLKFPPKPPSIL